MIIFLTVEISFFIANVAKIKDRWLFLIFDMVLVFIMVIWYRARKITNRYLQFVKLSDYVPRLVALSSDKDFPKYATHLVYLTKADFEGEIERRIMHSILHRKPKRAEVYWFVHINRSDNPYTMEYRTKEIVKGKVIRVDFNLGFRIQPRVNQLFKKVMQEMYTSKSIYVENKYESLDPSSFHADITYVIIEAFLSVENDFKLKEGFIMDTYFTIKNLSQSDQKAFGLDTAVTVIEKVPLLISSKAKFTLINKNV
jgi:KUP system potassium uptake protein